LIPLPQKANSSCEDGVRLQIFQQSDDVRVSDPLAFPLMPIARIGSDQLVFGLGFLKLGRDLVDRALQRVMQQLSSTGERRLAGRCTHFFRAEKKSRSPKSATPFELAPGLCRRVGQRVWWRIDCGFGDDDAWLAFNCCDPCTVYGEVEQVSTAIERESIVKKAKIEEKWFDRALQSITGRM
jgi:hypothetical protein